MSLFASIRRQLLWLCPSIQIVHIPIHEIWRFFFVSNLSCIPHWPVHNTLYFWCPSLPLTACWHLTEISVLLSPSSNMLGMLILVLRESKQHQIYIYQFIYLNLYILLRRFSKSSASNIVSLYTYSSWYFYKVFQKPFCVVAVSISTFLSFSDCCRALPSLTITFYWISIHVVIWIKRSEILKSRHQRISMCSQRFSLNLSLCQTFFHNFRCSLHIWILSSCGSLSHIQDRTKNHWI